MRDHGSNPGVAPTFVIGGGKGWHARGGRNLPPPPVMNKRIQVEQTDHPSTDRWVSLTTVHEGLDFTYRVAVVNGFSTHITPPRDYPDLDQARRAARRLLRRMENSR